MYYGAVKDHDIANGAGVRVSLFVSGCRNHCKGCFQPETWSFTYGSEFTTETEDHILELLNPPYIQGLTILGGDPFEPENQKALLPFIARTKQTFPDKDIWMYSGYTYEELTGRNPHCSIPETAEILDLIDVLIDGRFEEDLRDLTLQFRGSSNQRIIDVKKTRTAKEVVIWTEHDAGQGTKT
ncbi:anaerobic ribonucleoside-triphosphate reductase activating protein [Ruminococcaceae bacterium YRB3002]|nr:anaerobic ribonucleoside-triphosphate reductase activating protein [Ruminococcaceae bacterium YRB3002]